MRGAVLELRRFLADQSAPFGVLDCTELLAQRSEISVVREEPRLLQLTRQQALIADELAIALAVEGSWSHPSGSDRHVVTTGARGSAK